MISFGEEKRIVHVLSRSVRLYIYLFSAEVGLFDLVEVTSVRLGRSDKSSTGSKCQEFDWVEVRRVRLGRSAKSSTVLCYGPVLAGS
jgi:hypothetical protein